MDNKKEKDPKEYYPEIIYVFYDTQNGIFFVEVDKDKMTELLQMAKFRLFTSYKLDSFLVPEIKQTFNYEIIDKNNIQIKSI